VKKYNIFLFDADDTLYDFGKASAYAIETLFAKYNYPFELELPNKFNTMAHDLWQAFERGEITGYDVKTERFVRLFSMLNISHNPAEFNDEYIHLLGKSSFLLDGAEDICRKINESGKNIYVITNGFKNTCKARDKFSPIARYKSATFVSEEIGYSKPAPEFFRHVLENIGSQNIKEILIVGDSLSADIGGGIAADIDTCWYNPHGYKNNSGVTPTYEIKQLCELEQFI